MLRLIGATYLMLLFAVVSYAESPEALLSKLPPDHQVWVNRSCPKSFPAARWTSCITREATAVSPGMPDLSKLNPDEKNWVLRSCPTSWLPPSVVIPCLTRELQALLAGVPSLIDLSRRQLAWVQNSCPLTLPPSLYRPCVTRETAVASGVMRSPIARSTSQPAIAVFPVPPSQPTGEIRRADVHVTEGSHNDATFIINREKYEAQSNCFNMDEGDPLTYVEGSVFGACLSAVIVNQHTDQKCEVWCEPLDE